MSRQDYFICFAVFGFLSVLLMQLIRLRVKKRHPELYAKFGYPSFNDSNLKREHWAFQRFIFWGHISEVNDRVLHGLCVAASIAGLIVGVLFFLCI